MREMPDEDKVVIGNPTIRKVEEAIKEKKLLTAKFPSMFDSNISKDI